MGPKETRSGSEPRQGIRPQSAKPLRSKSEKTNLKREKSPSREPSNMPKNKIVIAMNKLFDVANNNNYTNIDRKDISFKFYDNSKTKDSDVKQPVLAAVNAYIVDENPDVLFAVEAKPLDNKIDQQTFQKLLDNELNSDAVKTMLKDALDERTVKQNMDLTTDEKVKIATELMKTKGLKDDLIKGVINANVFEQFQQDTTDFIEKTKEQQESLNESHVRFFKEKEVELQGLIDEVNSQYFNFKTFKDMVEGAQRKIFLDFERINQRNSDIENNIDTNLLKHQLESKIEAAFKDKLFENKINELDGKIKQNNSSTVNEQQLAEANSKLDTATEQLTKANTQYAGAKALAEQAKQVNNKLDSLQSNLQKQKLEEAVQHAFENKYLHQRIDTVNDTIKTEAAEAAKTAAEAAVKTEISSYTEQLDALEDKLQELKQPKEPSSPTSVSQNDLKSQLENAIQRELERAHLQQQIDDLKTSYNDAVTQIDSVIQNYITDETIALTKLKTELEKQLGELNENKESETTSSIALTEQSMKEKLENAIQSELNRAHLQKQIDDLNSKIKEKQENIDSTSTVTAPEVSQEYASKEELKQLSDTVVKNQLEQAIKDAFTTQLILQNTQNNDKTYDELESSSGNRSRLGLSNKKPEYSPFRDAEFIENMYDVIDVIDVSKIEKDNNTELGTSYDFYKIKDHEKIQIVINHDHDYYDDYYYNKYNNIVYMNNQDVYDKYASTKNSILRVAKSYETESSEPTYYLEKLIPKFATAEEFQRFKLEHAILHAFESKLKQITNPPASSAASSAASSSSSTLTPGASPVAATPTSVTEGDIEFVDEINKGTGKKITIHTNLDKKKELTVGSIEDSFKADVANALNGVTESDKAETKIKELLKTNPYSDNKKLNELFNNFTVSIQNT